MIISSSYWVCILTNRSGSLYIGVANDLERRIGQHKAREIEGFTQKYRLNRLIYFEEFQSVRGAIGREKHLKKWRREKKFKQIAQLNPE